MQTFMNEEKIDQPSWLDRPILKKLKITTEVLIFIILIVLAFISRFYDAGSRVMSHDENTHTFYSWKLYQGQGFAHDPLMHGPLQFHLVALSYFLFGDDDFTAKIPAMLSGILTIAFIWNYRRYLGKTGALIAAFLFLISPYMLYYSRYVRNEAFVALFGVITLWAILRYIETGQARYLYYLTAANVLHFTAKETSFIYTAQALLFLGLYFITKISNRPWRKRALFKWFYITLLVTILLVILTGTIWFVDKKITNPVTQTPTISEEATQQVNESPRQGVGSIILATSILSIISLGSCLYFLIDGYGWGELKKERSFDLIIVIGTLVLPQLSAFIIRGLGIIIPTNSSEVTALVKDMNQIIIMAIVLIPMFLLSIAIGLLWKPKLWLINAGIWYGIFTLFYTTVFTNGAGFLTGTVGSLGYWLEQQGVNRGSQPWYYYGLVQIPIYEFLPAIGCILAIVYVILGKWRVKSLEIQAEDTEITNDTNEVPVVPLLGFWTITSLIAFSIAGEKMPWLTVHIALPMILLSGWSLGKFIDGINWKFIKEKKGWLILIIFTTFFISLIGVIRTLLGGNLPFQGKELIQLQNTSTFVFSIVVMFISGISLLILLKSWTIIQFIKLFTFSVFTLLAILTIHTSIQASYQNYNNANELLVYAHSAGGVKEALAQIEEISKRTTDGLDMIVAYDSETSYPYYWYLRNYRNARFFGKEPTRSLREADAILVGDLNYGKVEPIVGELYYPFEYIRLWWPNQDYYNLNWKRIWGAITNPQTREALFQIWLNRDYTKYGQVTGKDMNLTNWQPSTKMRLYLKKDLVSKLWNYGVGPSEGEMVVDPYEDKGITLAADQIIGSTGEQPGQFLRPHDLAFAPDETIYVCDTDNNRIQHLSKTGEVLQSWGSYGDISTGEAPGGSFNQPWGIAVGLDGSVYVADLWNHRIQKFSSEGQFIKMWGYFGQAETPEAFWGPRDIAVDSKGNIFITDTGNKRVVVFTPEGEFVQQFGSVGMAPGQFDEPVGIAIDLEDQVYIADTWNQRIQVFKLNPAGEYLPTKQWDIAGWYGQSLDNKPYLAVDGDGHVFATDPEGVRVLEFLATGEFIRYWGDAGSGPENFSLVGSVAVDPSGGVWVTDTGNNRLMHFTLPSP